MEGRRTAVGCSRCSDGVVEALAQDNQNEVFSKPPLRKSREKQMMKEKDKINSPYWTFAKGNAN
jgi:hypothetical protein